MGVTESSATALRDAQEIAPSTRRAGGRLSAGHVVMVLAAVLAALLNYSVLRARDDSVRVAVAAQTLVAGKAVPENAFRYVDVRVDEALLATLLRPVTAEQRVGWVAATAVGAGELLRAADLRPPSAPLAQRAMSIPVDPEHAVSGEIRAGDRVDVIEVRDGEATYVVTNAEVLSVAGRDAPVGLGAGAPFSLTVAVDDALALRLALAIRGESLEVVRSTGSAPASSPPARANGRPLPPPAAAAQAS